MDEHPISKHHITFVILQINHPGKRQKAARTCGRTNGKTAAEGAKLPAAKASKTRFMCAGQHILPKRSGAYGALILQFAQCFGSAKLFTPISKAIEFRHCQAKTSALQDVFDHAGNHLERP